MESNWIKFHPWPARRGENRPEVVNKRRIDFVTDRAVVVAAGEVDERRKGKDEKNKSKEENNVCASRKRKQNMFGVNNREVSPPGTKEAKAERLSALFSPKMRDSPEQLARSSDGVVLFRVSGNVDKRSNSGVKNRKGISETTTLTCHR
jgi:hypothetical protein